MILFWPRVHRWEKWSQSGKTPPSGRAEIIERLNRRKVTFSISTPPSGGAFECLLHFYHLWTITQKSIIQIFDTLSINKFQWNFAPCISGILNSIAPFVFWATHECNWTGLRMNIIQLCPFWTYSLRWKWNLCFVFFYSIFLNCSPDQVWWTLRSSRFFWLIYLYTGRRWFL